MGVGVAGPPGRRQRSTNPRVIAVRTEISSGTGCVVKLYCIWNLQVLIVNSVFPFVNVISVISGTTGRGLEYIEHTYSTYSRQGTMFCEKVSLYNRTTLDLQYVRVQYVLHEYNHAGDPWSSRGERSRRALQRFLFRVCIRLSRLSGTARKGVVRFTRQGVNVPCTGTRSATRPSGRRQLCTCMGRSAGGQIIRTSSMTRSYE
jgi:hypothetical protein